MSYDIRFCAFCVWCGFNSAYCHINKTLRICTTLCHARIFPEQIASKIVEISEHMAKLWRKLKWLVFFWDTVYINTRQWTLDKGRKPRGGGVWGGAVPPPSQENFWWFNLEMAHFDAYLRYCDVLILSSAAPVGRGVCGVRRGCAPSQKIFDYY